MYKFSNNCFYPYHLRANYEAAGTWPESGVDVSETIFQKFTQTPPDGMQQGTDGRGYPTWLPIPPMTTEEKAAEIRSRRNSLLAEVDNIGPVRWASMSQEMQSSWLAYRVELLNVPQQIGFPDSVRWPVKPE